MLSLGPNDLFVCIISLLISAQKHISAVFLQFQLDFDHPTPTFKILQNYFHFILDSDAFFEQRIEENSQHERK